MKNGGVMTFFLIIFFTSLGLWSAGHDELDGLHGALDSQWTMRSSEPFKTQMAECESEFELRKRQVASEVNFNDILLPVLASCYAPLRIQDLPKALTIVDKTLLCKQGLLENAETAIGAISLYLAKISQWIENEIINFPETARPLPLSFKNILHGLTYLPKKFVTILEFYTNTQVYVCEQCEEKYPEQKVLRGLFGIYDPKTTRCLYIPGPLSLLVGHYGGSSEKLSYLTAHPRFDDAGNLMIHSFLLEFLSTPPNLEEQRQTNVNSNNRLALNIAANLFLSALSLKSVTLESEEPKKMTLTFSLSKPLYGMMEIKRKVDFANLLANRATAFEKKVDRDLIMISDLEHTLFSLMGEWLQNAQFHPNEFDPLLPFLVARVYTENETKTVTEFPNVDSDFAKVVGEDVALKITNMSKVAIETMKRDVQPFMVLGQENAFDGVNEFVQEMLLLIIRDMSIGVSPEDFYRTIDFVLLQSIGRILTNIVEYQPRQINVFNRAFLFNFLHYLRTPKPDRDFGADFRRAFITIFQAFDGEGTYGSKPQVQKPKDGPTQTWKLKGTQIASLSKDLEKALYEHEKALQFRQVVSSTNLAFIAKVGEKIDLSTIIAFAVDPDLDAHFSESQRLEDCEKAVAFCQKRGSLVLYLGMPPEDLRKFKDMPLSYKAYKEMKHQSKEARLKALEDTRIRLVLEKRAV